MAGSVRKLTVNHDGRPLSEGIGFRIFALRNSGKGVLVTMALRDALNREFKLGQLARRARAVARTTLPIILAVGSLCICSSGAWAQRSKSLYTWQDEKGVTHYATKPSNQAATPADLPPIMRGEMKLPTVRAVSCDSHGGVDCRAGADTDGSVICSDGFRGATPRFRFSCASPKLEVSDITPVDHEGVFSVIVRNHRSVVAQQMSVVLNRERGDRIPLTGPDEVEAYGMAEFQGRHPEGSLGGKPSIGEIVVSCANCPN